VPQQFAVPQFIDAEDKIMGPVTVRQFLILIVAALGAFIIWKLATFWLAIVLAVLWFILAVVVAFVKINGQNFHVFLLSFVRTLVKPNLRVWKKDYTKEELTALMQMAPKVVVKEAAVQKERVARGRLSELSLTVNSGGAFDPKDYE